MNLVLLGISLGFLGIIAYLVFLLRNSPAPVRQVAENQVIENTVTQITVRKINPPGLFSNLLTRPLDWSQIENTNYTLYIRNLRDFSCPEETVQDIVIADIAKMYAKRRAELLDKLPKPPYWKTRETFTSSSPDYLDIQVELARLGTEQRALVQALLGVDYDREIACFTGHTDLIDAQLDFLKPERHTEVKALLKKYHDLENEYLASLDEAMLAADSDELRVIQEQLNEDLTAILSPEELREFQLRNSPAARELRTSLAAFDPSEKEFRQIYEIQNSLKETFGQRFNSDDLRNEEIRNRVIQESGEAYKEELKKLLGTERYAEYKRSQDSDYQTLAKLSSQYGFSENVADRIYQMKVTAEEQRQRLLSNSDLTDAQIQAAWTNIYQEIQGSVKGMLGKDGYDAYRQAGGDWIVESAPAPPSASQSKNTATLLVCPHCGRPAGIPGSTPMDPQGAMPMYMLKPVPPPPPFALPPMPPLRRQ